MTSIGSLREGNDPAVRPQDDLFGHVNGGWYDTVEIPDDLPGFGAFVQLRLNAEQQVGDLLREAAAAAQSGAAEPGSTTQQIGDLFAAFLDEERVEELGVRPIEADLAAVRAVSTRSGLVGLLGRLEREGAGRRRLCRLRQDRRPQVGPVRREHHPGRARPSRRGLLPRGPVRGHPLRRTSPTSPPCCPWPASTTRTRRRSASWRWRPGWPPGTGTPWRAATSSRPTTSRAPTSLPRWRPPSTSPPGRAGLGAPEAALAEVVVRQPSYLEALSRGIVRPAPRRLEALADVAGRALVRAVPLARRSWPRTSTSTRGHSPGTAGAARPLEAWRGGHRVRPG